MLENNWTNTLNPWTHANSTGFNWKSLFSDTCNPTLFEHSYLQIIFMSAFYWKCWVNTRQNKSPSIWKKKKRIRWPLRCFSKRTNNVKCLWVFQQKKEYIILRSNSLNFLARNASIFLDRHFSHFSSCGTFTFQKFKLHVTTFRFYFIKTYSYAAI
jgi:hypothetical protein